MSSPSLVGRTIEISITQRNHKNGSLTIRLRDQLDDAPIVDGDTSLHELGQLFIGGDATFTVTRSWLHNDPDPPPALVPPTEDEIDMAQLQRMRQGVLALRKEMGVTASSTRADKSLYLWFVRRLDAILAGTYP